MCVAALLSIVIILLLPQQCCRFDSPVLFPFKVVRGHHLTNESTNICILYIAPWDWHAFIPTLPPSSMLALRWWSYWSKQTPLRAATITAGSVGGLFRRIFYAGCRCKVSIVCTVIVERRGQMKTFLSVYILHPPQYVPVTNYLRAYL